MEKNALIVLLLLSNIFAVFYIVNSRKQAAREKALQVRTRLSMDLKRSKYLKLNRSEALKMAIAVLGEPEGPIPFIPLDASIQQTDLTDGFAHVFTLQYLDENQSAASIDMNLKDNHVLLINVISRGAIQASYNYPFIEHRFMISFNPTDQFIEMKDESLKKEYAALDPQFEMILKENNAEVIFYDANGSVIDRIDVTYKNDGLVE